MFKKLQRIVGIIVVINLTFYPFTPLFNVFAHTVEGVPEEMIETQGLGKAVAKVADVSVSITDYKTTAQNGEVSVYQISFKNNGNANSASFPTTIVLPQYFQVTRTDISDLKVNGNKATFEHGILIPKEECVYTITGKVVIPNDVDKADLNVKLESKYEGKVLTAEDTTKANNQDYVKPPETPDFTVYLTCVEEVNSNSFKAYFGYNNKKQDLNLDISEAKPNGTPPTTLKSGKFDKNFFITIKKGEQASWRAKAGILDITAKATSDSTPCAKPPVEPPKPPKLGSITVCITAVNKNGEVVDGSVLPNSSFSLKGFKPATNPSIGGPTNTLIPQTDVAVPIGFNTVALNTQNKKDANCKTYSNLPLGNYFYTDEIINGEKWLKPVYNDQFSIGNLNPADFAEYQAHLFDNNSGNDSQRHPNADGAVTLTDASPNRTILVVNRYDPKLDEVPVVKPDEKFGVYFDSKDTGICVYDAEWRKVTGTVNMPESVKEAKLQLSWYVVHPKDSSRVLDDGKNINEIRYFDYGVVKNGHRFEIMVYWPGVKPAGQNETVEISNGTKSEVVEIHIGGNLLDPKTTNQLPGVQFSNGIGGLDYYWGPSVCPAPEEPEAELIPPVAVPDLVHTPFNTPVDITVMTNDYDEDGTLIPNTVQILENPSHGTVTVNKETGVTTYTPNNGFSGTDIFKYKVCDNDNLCDDTNVTVIIAPPVEIKGSITVCVSVIDQDGKLVDGGKLSGTIFKVTGTKVGSNVYPGSYIDSIPDTEFKTPLKLDRMIFSDSKEFDVQCYAYSNLKLGYYGYKQEEIIGEGWEAPIYNDQYNKKVTSFHDFYEYDGKLYDENPQNDGERNLNADGDISLTPERPHRTLVVLNRYKVKDLPQEPVIEPPVAVPDEVTTEFNTPIRIDILTNDEKGSSDLVPNTVVVTEDPKNGTMIVNPETGVSLYTPNDGFSGIDTFKYKVCDENKLCSETIVTINIQPPVEQPQPPTVIVEPVPIIQPAEVSDLQVQPNIYFDSTNLLMDAECGLGRMNINGMVVNADIPIDKIEISLDGGASWILVGDVNGLGTTNVDFNYSTGKLSDGVYSVAFRATLRNGSLFSSETFSTVMSCSCGIVILGDYYQNGFGEGFLTSVGDLIYNSDLGLTLFAETLGGVKRLKLELALDNEYKNIIHEQDLAYNFETRIWSVKVDAEFLNQQKTYARLVAEGCETIIKPIPTIINATLLKSETSAKLSKASYSYEVYYKHYDRWEKFDYKNDISGQPDAKFNLFAGLYYIKVILPDQRVYYSKKFELSSPSVVEVKSPTTFVSTSPFSFIDPILTNVDVLIYSKELSTLELEDIHNDPEIKNKYKHFAIHTDENAEYTKYIFIYWNRWDPIFNEQLNHIEKLSEGLKNEQVVVLTDPNNKEEIKNISRNTKLNLKIVEVTDGEFLNKELRYLPEFVLLDVEKNTLQRVRGNLTLNEITDELSNRGFLNNADINY